MATIGLNPSLNTMRIIADGLSVPLYSLFIDDINHNSLILRKSDRSKVYREDSAHVVYDLLSPDYMKSNVDILWSILKAHSESTSGYWEHNKEEFAIIMKGEVEVIIDDQSHLLQEGDTVRILPRMKHKFRNERDDTVEILYVLVHFSL